MPPKVLRRPAAGLPLVRRPAGIFRRPAAAVIENGSPLLGAVAVWEEEMNWCWPSSIWSAWESCRGSGWIHAFTGWKKLRWWESRAPTLRGPMFIWTSWWRGPDPEDSWSMSQALLKGASSCMCARGSASRSSARMAWYMVVCFAKFRVCPLRRGCEMRARWSPMRIVLFVKKLRS